MSFLNGLVNFDKSRFVRSEDMKPLERIFFMACLHEQIRVCELNKREFSVRAIGNIFERLGFSYKQLMYYVEKWDKRGFYEYGVSLDLGWFVLENLAGEYKKIYEEMGVGTPWRDMEFAKYIVQRPVETKCITNFSLRNQLGIGEDRDFYDPYRELKPNEPNEEESTTIKNLEEENKRLLDIIDNKLGGWLEWCRNHGSTNGISYKLYDEMFDMAQKCEDIEHWLNREIEMAKISMEEYAEFFDGVHVDNKTRKELLKGHIRFCENALKILKE